MTIDLIWGVVSDQAGPRRIGCQYIASTIAEDIKFLMAKGQACLLNERSRGVKVSVVSNFTACIVCRSTKFAINYVSIFIGGKVERKSIALVRPSDGDLASAKGQQRQEW